MSLDEATTLCLYFCAEEALDKAPLFSSPTITNLKRLYIMPCLRAIQSANE